MTINDSFAFLWQQSQLLNANFLKSYWPLSIYVFCKCGYMIVYLIDIANSFSVVTAIKKRADLSCNVTDSSKWQSYSKTETNLV